MEIPAEVQATLDAARDEIKALDRDALVERYNVAYPDAPATDESRDSWLKRKLTKFAHAQIKKEAGLEEKMTEKTTAAATEGNGEEKTKKKAGRKKQSISGTFKLAVPEGGSLGRAGSTKHGIMTTLSELGRPFTHPEFIATVKEVMKWDAEAETFGIDTRFKTLGLASAAWFSELRNKAKVIVQDTPGTPEPEAEAAQPSA